MADTALLSHSKTDLDSKSAPGRGQRHALNGGEVNWSLSVNASVLLCQSAHKPFAVVALLTAAVSSPRCSHLYLQLRCKKLLQCSPKRWVLPLSYKSKQEIKGSFHKLWSFQTVAASPSVCQYVSELVCRIIKVEVKIGTIVQSCLQPSCDNCGAAHKVTKKQEVWRPVPCIPPLALW